MIITDKFVMLNFPKTGSSFARKVIKKLYEQAGLPLTELKLPNIRNLQSHEKADQHGGYCQIPMEHRNKQVISIVRNPVDRFLSTYIYRAWVYAPTMPLDKVSRYFPDFPELSPTRYLEFMESSLVYRLGYEVDHPVIGTQSIQAVQIFFKNPPATLRKIFSGDYLKDDLMSEMREIRFLRQENLRVGLFNFLSSLGFSADQLYFIFTDKDSNVTGYDKVNKYDLITDDVRRYIEEKEWLYQMVLDSIEWQCC